MSGVFIATQKPEYDSWLLATKVKEGWAYHPKLSADHTIFIAVYLLRVYSGSFPKKARIELLGFQLSLAVLANFRCPCTLCLLPIKAMMHSTGSFCILDSKILSLKQLCFLTSVRLISQHCVQRTHCILQLGWRRVAPSMVRPRNT